MRPTSNIFIAVLFLLLCQLTISAYGQLGTGIDIKKPKEYEERVLRSEKSDQNKFTLPRRFIQNTITHYNYVFNANVKLNDVIARAKTSFVDDYSVLLPFYNYSLDMTIGDSLQLDSIISKSQSGIALHDLRNDWVDNLYLLWGAAYYLQKEFDSAYLMFQYINYAFAEKEKDGYYKTIGSTRDGNSAYSISTKEKTSLPRKIFSEPPSRNEAFIWQIRNFLAQDQFAEAASLIVTLRDDPVFPKRLYNDLEEVQAYWFYKQNMWDSAAAHLVLALDNTTNKQERARWEYLAAQLYELSGQYKESEKYYTKAIGHTTDPILDIYARLYSIRVNKDGGEDYIDKNIAELLKMAKRDRYEDYRDIIYYMAAQMQLERNNVDGAMPLLLKSTQYSSNNLTNRNKAFLQLAELSFAKKQYRASYNFYDSLIMDDLALKNPEQILQRKEMLGRIASNIEIIERQDSLQRIAALPEEERKDYVKKLSRQLRKEKGLKDEGSSGGSSLQSGTTAAISLFANNETKGEWYFYNSNSRQKGAASFKAKWGNRVNTDNWRRSASRTALQDKVNNPNAINNPKTTTVKGQPQDTDPDITFDGLYNNLPLTTALLQQSNDSIQTAMFKLGKGYIQDIEDCAIGTETLENLRIRFPSFTPMDEVLFNLYYCYSKNGEPVKAAAIKKMMSEKYDLSNFTTIVTTGKNPASKTGNVDATKAYEKIYDLFIEGNFAEAVAQKKIADSMYNSSHWTPQLLYIEAVYYIRQREDSSAVTVLNTIVTRFAGTPLATKASNLITVLGRRSQIEEELRNLTVNRPQDTTLNRPVTDNAVIIPPTGTDTTSIKPPVAPPVVKNNTPVKDSETNKPLQSVPAASFVYTADAPYYVAFVLNKVDPVFSSEAKNAFFRYNRETFFNKQFTIENTEIDPDNKLMLISPFKNADEAIAYVEKTRPKTASEIIPWLKGGKYYFTIITDKNLEILKSNKNMEGYKTFLNQYLPGKF